MKKILLTILFTLAFSLTASADKGQEGVYVMGVSFSFADSVAYFTEIQFIEGVELEKKSKFLPDRQHYTYELKDYMTFNENRPGRTSVILFSKKLKSLKTQEQKVKNRLEKRRGLTVRYLGDKFKFTRP